MQSDMSPQDATSYAYIHKHIQGAEVTGQLRLTGGRGLSRKQKKEYKNIKAPKLVLFV